MVERATTAAGGKALTMVFGGAVTVMGASEPWLFGIAGATRHFTPHAGCAHASLVAWSAPTSSTSRALNGA